uniref:Uncharacterized protein n=1 Tax=Tetranychus urticae TaxID=32264 RepID=T1K3W8_TETUR
MCSKMQVKVSSIIGLFCLTGCFYQIYDITKSYLQFKVRHDVAYDYSTSIELPAIDIMVPMPMALNYSIILATNPEEMNLICAQLNKKYKELNYKIDDSHGRCEDAIPLSILAKDPIAFSLNVSANITVQDIHLASIDLEHQVIEIFVPFFGSLNHEHCKTTRYYNGLAIFMRIFCLNGTKPFSVNTNFVSRNLGYSYFLRYSFGIHFGIRLSDPADLPIFERNKYFMITREPGSFPVVTISSVKTVMSSLEYPYETNCRYYNKDKSISKCMAEYTLSQSTPYLFKTAIYEWNEHPSHLGFNGDNNDNQRNDGNKVNQGELDAFINCNQQAAATQCEKTEYLLEGKISDQEMEYGLILFKPSWKANINLSVHPILPWDQYVILIGSIVGIWFGVSMLDYMLKITTIIKTTFTSLKHKLNNETNEIVVDYDYTQ